MKTIAGEAAMSVAARDLRPQIFALLEKDLPRLRQQFPNSFVAYGMEGLLFPPESSRWTLFEKCRESGLKIGEYLIESTAPEETEISITETEILFPFGIDPD